MDGSSRRIRFETRISTERDFLATTNERFGAVAPLAGMTHDAIRSWSRRVTEATGLDLAAVTRILLEASSRADLMADNSKDVFEPQERPAPDTIFELKRMLETALSGQAFSEIP